MTHYVNECNNSSFFVKFKKKTPTNKIQKNVGQIDVRNKSISNKSMENKIKKNKQR